MKLFTALGWLRQVVDEVSAAGVLFIKPALKVTEGAAYIHPEKDGASYWEMR